MGGERDVPVRLSILAALQPRAQIIQWKFNLMLGQIIRTGICALK